MPVTRTPPALIVSDLGGTTVADPGLIVPALRTALGHVGVVEVSDDAVASVRGADKRVAVATLLSEHGADPDLTERALEIFKEIVLADVQDGHYHALPGAERFLRDARQVGVPLVITTGFPVDVCDALLQHLGWVDLVVTSVSAEEVDHGRPAPDLIEEAMARARVRDAALVANIGDTANDLASGRAAGVGWNIAVLTGAHSRRLLQAQPGDIVLDDLGQVAGLLGIGT